MTIEEKKIFLMLRGWKVFTQEIVPLSGVSSYSIVNKTQLNYAWTLGVLDDHFYPTLAASDFYRNEYDAIEWAYKYAIENNA